jgi:uncharacterized RDD family membrane protein YckC
MSTVTQPFATSSRRKRIAAFILDHCVITFLIVSTIFLALGPDFIDQDDSELSFIMLSVMLPGFLLYIVKDSIKGISFGKWVIGVMVRDSVNPSAIPAFGRLVVRNLFLVIWPVEFLFLVFSQEKRRLGDKTVKTIVIENNNKSATLYRTLVIAGLALLFSAFMFLFASSAMKNSDAYKVAVWEIEANEEIIKVTGGIKGYGMMPTGSISVSNGSGQAQLQIKVIGNTRDLRVNVYLTKVPQGQWNLIKIEK